eukprot:2692187-Rhodomonas_salina.1
MFAISSLERAGLFRKFWGMLLRPSAVHWLCCYAHVRYWHRLCCYAHLQYWRTLCCYAVRGTDLGYPATRRGVESQLPSQ